MTPTLRIVPGLRDHVPQHWQTLLEQPVPGARSVSPLEHDKLSRAARVAALETALQAIDGPVILVAHSAGVTTTAHGAQQHQRPIHGALLVTPVDLKTRCPKAIACTARSRPVAGCHCRARLPFPRIAEARRNDPLAAFERTCGLSADCCRHVEDLGNVGHLNPAAWRRKTPGGSLHSAGRLAPPLSPSSLHQENDMAKTIRIHETGGPGVLRCETVGADVDVSTTTPRASCTSRTAART